MRVLQIVQKPQRRGAEVFAHQLNRWLRSRGHETRTAYLYAYSGSEALPREDTDLVLNGVEESRLELMPGMQPQLLWALRRFVRDFSPDIVQLNGARSVKYGAALKLFASRGAWKMVYRNIDSPLFWVKGILRTGAYRRWIMPRVDGVVGVSRQTLAEVLDFYRLPVPHVFIPNGVDFELLAPVRDPEVIRAQLSTPCDAVVALFMGSLSRQKRPDRFLRIMAKATAEVPGLYGWLLGDGPQRSELEEQVAALGLNGRIRFLGYQEKVGDFIKAADFHVSTSDTEGIPAVVLEAGYLGKPSIAPRIGGLHECIQDGVTGFLVRPGDEPGLVSRITELTRSRELRQRLGLEAHALIQDTFSIDRVGEQYESFYVSLGASRPNGGR